jgi:hypothetical protein
VHVPRGFNMKTSGADVLAGSAAAVHTPFKQRPQHQPRQARRLAGLPRRAAAAAA